MKKLAQLKRKNLIQRILIPAFAAVLFCCLLIGIIFGIGKKGERLTASADNEAASFTAGASIGNSVANADQMRFRLNINNSNQIAQIKIQVNPFVDCSFSEDFSRSCEYTKSNGEAGIMFSSDASRYDIDLHVNPQIEYGVTAYITKTDSTVLTLESDKRSVAYVLSKMKEAGDPKYENAANLHKEYMESVTSIYETGSVSSFTVNPAASMLRYDGSVDVSINLTDSDIALLKSEETTTSKEELNSLDTLIKYQRLSLDNQEYQLDDACRTALPFFRAYVEKTVTKRHCLFVIAEVGLSWYGATGEGLASSPWKTLFYDPDNKYSLSLVYEGGWWNAMQHSEGSHTLSLTLPAEKISNAATVNYYAMIVERTYTSYTFQQYNVKWGNQENTLNREHFIGDRYEYNAQRFSGNHFSISKKTWASEILSESDLSTMETWKLHGYQRIAGTYTSDEQIPVTVKYKALSGGGDYIEETTSVFNVNSLYVRNMKSVVNTLFTLGKFKQLSDFNVVRKNSFFDKDNLERQTGDRIIRQATGYKYEYDSTNQKGTLTIEYSDFHYKDLMITMQSNDAESHLTKDFYTANATQANGKITVVFNYDDLEMWAKNNCGWLFELQEKHFSIVDNSGGKVLIANNGSARTLTLMCSEADENALGEVSIKAVSEIVEDVLYSMTYKYKIIEDAAGELVESTKTSAPVQIMYSDLLAMSYGNFMTKYGSVINADLLPASLVDTNYCVAKDYQKAYDTENQTCEITVVYEYRPIFKVTDNQDKNFYKFLPTSDTSLLYTGEYFYISEQHDQYDGFRLQGISTTLDSTFARVTSGYKREEMKFELLRMPEQGSVLPVCLNFTDIWLLEINYMQQYKQTPFAEKTKYTGEIKVKDYPDIYALTTADLTKILGLNSMSIIRDRSTVDEITVNYDGIGTYTVNTTYTPLSMVQRDSSGKQQNEVCVPLSCYKEWCEDYGKDWTILYLNYAGNVYFRYSNEVKPENLYGFFSVAIFDNKISDLNDVFSSFDSTGCKTFHSEEEVRGSRIYKFFRSDEGTLATVLSFSTAGLISGKVFKCAVVGIAFRRIALAFCESPLSDSDNAVYTSRFFFLDGTSDTPIMAENGSTDPGNTNGAAGNAALDVIDSVKDWFLNLKDSVFNSTYAKIIAVGFGIVLVVLICVLIIRLIRFAFSGSGGKRRR